MISIRNISIRGKLIIMQVFTSLLVLGIFLVVYIYTDIRDYKQRKVNNVAGLARVIAKNNVSTLLFHDNDAANDILNDLRNTSPEIMYAAIFDDKGKLFASYTRTPADTAGIVTDFTRIQSTEFAGDHLFVREVITGNNNERIGSVLFKIELVELQAIKESKYRIAALLLLISVGFCFLVAFIIQPYISKRLLLLVNKMKQVSATGDYSTPVTDDQKDEISTLFDVFNSMMQQIMENEKKKDEFIGIASHELKTPLTTIKGYLELLDGMEDQQPKKQFIQKGRENVFKLERLIKDLLDVSKIQSGQLELNMKQFDMDELLDETISSFQMTTVTHEVRKNGTVTKRHIYADRQRIEQVLINLLSNAVKYSPGKDSVIVSGNVAADGLVITIRDFGIGIPEEEKANVFERFYRTKNVSVHIAGFGLGLYICKDIITRHNGKIWVQREEEGTSFAFFLPFTADIQEQNE